MKLKEFEVALEVARAERLKTRKRERKNRRKAEAAALKKAEEEKECEFPARVLVVCFTRDILV